MSRDHWLAGADTDLFLALNGAHAEWLDGPMVWISEMAFWFPLYAFFLYLLQRRFGWRGLAWAVPVLAAMIFASDTGSVVLFKNTVQRLRPCWEPALEGLVHVVDGCGGQYGFVSSHAANHFAVAAFMIGVLREVRWAATALIVWALLVSYSRIYLGVHYPGDVLVGGLYGLTIGLIFFAIFRRIVQKQAP
ncbi:MAG TPA: phosphatase PAP2 family protein [Flavobacteriales bacterium]|nr:phosphatase PAP2 family protein [Flavobacteriales bacterium]